MAAENVYLKIFLITLLFIALGFWRIHRSFLNWPLIGMLPTLLLNVGRIHEICTQVLQNCRRGTFHFRGPWLANMDILLTVHPANVHYIMTSNFQNFPKGARFREIFDVLGDGIFTADSDSWRDQRRAAKALIAGPTFLRFLARVTREKAEAAMLPLLDAAAAVENRVIDLQDLFQRLTFDTSCVTITGYDPGCLSPDFPHVPFAEAMDAAEESIFMRHVVPERVCVKPSDGVAIQEGCGMHSQHAKNEVEGPLPTLHEADEKVVHSDSVTRVTAVTT